MKSLKLTVFLLLLLPMLAMAQKKEKKPKLPEALDQAHLVFVEAVDGEEFKPGLDTADRLAIADLRDALQSWGRYKLTVEREKADLIFVVRKGRPAEDRAGVDIDGSGAHPIGDPQGGPQGGQMGGQPGGQMGSQFPGQQRQRDTDMGVGGEAGSEDDMLKVCQLNVNGKLSNPLWIRTFKYGLDAPRLTLLAQFKDELEKVYPIVPASPPAKP
jgi:hypothetical protein